VGVTGFGARNLVRERALYDSLFDPVTQLPTWALLVDRTHMALAHALRTNRNIAVFVLEDPRPVGGRPFDTLEFAYQLRGQVRTDDTVARIGPTTFVVVCNEVDALGDDLSVIAERFSSSLGVTCRIGAALGEIGDAPERLLYCAIERATAR
jgi:GGDEF domain-containing protein